MIKKFLVGISTAALTVCGIFAFGINASAATIDEVASTARSLGFPESYIQQGYNQYYEDPSLYTPDVLDDAIAYLYNYESEIKSKLGISDAPEASVTTAADNKSDQTVTQTNVPDNKKDDSSASAAIPNKPTPDEFINMTLDEKRDYVSTLTPEQQQQFFNGLSADELKSIVKQLPSDDKVDVMDTFIQAGEAMGIKVTVDEINNDGISMSMRNNKGELIDVAAVGVVIEDTGYDYRGIFALSGALILAACAGLWFVIKKCFGREAEDENE